MLKDKILEPHTPPHNKKRVAPKATLYPLCHTLTDYRTIVDDFYRVVAFVEWLKGNYPDKASYHTSKM